MAQTGYTPISLYYSTTATNAPSTGNLTNGELAINITDGKLFYKDNASAIQVIGWKIRPANAGGTGQTSFAVGDLLYADTTSTLAKLADVATGNALISGGVSTAPSWGKIALTTHVSGVLPVTNGGTNASTASITSFNNITGYTASGATGTTSTNLVFSTSPSITTPTLVGDATLSTGNLVIGTSGKGIDFSAVVHSGSTSKLLNDYEQGTWTVTWQNLTGTPSNTTGYYTKVGRMVFITYAAGATALTGVANSTNFSLPFVPAVNAVGSAVAGNLTNNMAIQLNTGGAAYTQNFSAGSMTFSGVYHI